MLDRIREFFTRDNGLLGGAQRSPDWSKFRREFEKKYPKKCAVCGTKKYNELHHVKPFHLHPELELDESNLIWLCGENGNHHLWFGHLGSYESFNENVKEDAKKFLDKINNRP